MKEVALPNSGALSKAFKSIVQWVTGQWRSLRKNVGVTSYTLENFKKYYRGLGVASYTIYKKKLTEISIIASSRRNTRGGHDNPRPLRSFPPVTGVDRSMESNGRIDQWIEVISEEPRVVVYHNFLSQEECNHLINLARPHMQRSKVVDIVTGQGKDSSSRTSSGAFLRRGQDKTVQAIEKRIAAFTLLPVEHGEGLQVLHYAVGQKFEPHCDYFPDNFNTGNGGQRKATVLMYLSDVEEGGETIFPYAKSKISSVNWSDGRYELGEKGLSVKPKMGDALLFWSMRPDASVDPKSLHGGCPVIKGNKWASTKWIRVNPYS